MMGKVLLIIYVFVYLLRVLRFKTKNERTFIKTKRAKSMRNDSQILNWNFKPSRTI